MTTRSVARPRRTVCCRKNPFARKGVVRRRRAHGAVLQVWAPAPAIGRQVALEALVNKGASHGSKEVRVGLDPIVRPVPKAL